MTDVADAKLHTSHARQLGGRLLSKLAEALCGAFQARPRHWVGVGQQAHRETENDRLDARLQQRHPRAHGKKRTRQTGPDAGAAPDDEDGRKAADGHQERHDAERLGVDGCDDDEGDEVVKDDGRQHERAQPVGNAGAPTSASRPSAKAVSVDIAIPHPRAEELPALKSR